MDIIVQWATILSPLIAIALAIWAIRSSAKDTAKQIESIKELARIQIEVSMTQILKDMEESVAHSGQLSKRIVDESQHQYFGWSNHEPIYQREARKRDLEDKSKNCDERIRALDRCFELLVELRKRLGDK